MKFILKDGSELDFTKIVHDESKSTDSNEAFTLIIENAKYPTKAVRMAKQQFTEDNLSAVTIIMPDEAGGEDNILNMEFSKVESTRYTLSGNESTVYINLLV